MDLTYPTEHLGVSLKTFFDIAAGRHCYSGALRNATHPMLILSADLLDNEAVVEAVAQIAQHTGLQRPNWNGVCWLHKDASGVAKRDLFASTGLVDAAKDDGSTALKVLFAVFSGHRSHYGQQEE